MNVAFHAKSYNRQYIKYVYIIMNNRKTYKRNILANVNNAIQNFVKQLFRMHGDINTIKAN